MFIRLFDTHVEYRDRSGLLDTLFDSESQVWVDSLVAVEMIAR